MKLKAHMISESRAVSWMEIFDFEGMPSVMD